MAPLTRHPVIARQRSYKFNHVRLRSSATSSWRTLRHASLTARCASLGGHHASVTARHASVTLWDAVTCLSDIFFIDFLPESCCLLLICSQSSAIDPQNVTIFCRANMQSTVGDGEGDAANNRLRHRLRQRDSPSTARRR